MLLIDEAHLLHQDVLDHLHILRTTSDRICTDTLELAARRSSASSTASLARVPADRDEITDG